MLKVGLTGGIGSGKSLIAEIFSVIGIPVFNADTEAKALMETDEEIISSVQRLFGKDSYKDKRLNREYIANIVFNNPLELDKLNAVVHPAVIRHFEHWAANKTSKYIIKEAAIMFESGTVGNLDYIIGVQTPLILRIKRIIERDKISREEVLKRIQHQMDDSIKMKLCDFVIINDEQNPVIPQVLQIHEKLLGLQA